MSASPTGESTYTHLPYRQLLPFLFYNFNARAALRSSTHRKSDPRGPHLPNEGAPFLPPFAFRKELPRPIWHSKMRRAGDKTRSNNHGVHKNRKKSGSSAGGNRNANQINDMLKLCLEKVCALQEDLAKEEDLEEDPQAAGYTACAMETIRFLASQGLPADHPMVKVLTEKLFGEAT